MLLVTICFLTALCVWLVVAPLLAPASDFNSSNILGEIRVSEREDLLKFLESLEFEKARGLISEAEYLKQQSNVQKRLSKMSGEDA